MTERKAFTTLGCKLQTANYKLYNKSTYNSIITPFSPV